MMKIALGADHGGYELKCAIMDHLIAKGYEVKDYGTNSCESVDYAPIAAETARGSFPVSAISEFSAVEPGLVFPWRRIRSKGFGPPVVLTTSALSIPAYIMMQTSYAWAAVLWVWGWLLNWWMSFEYGV